MTIETSTIDIIKRHGQTTYPEECCGFLIGSWDESGSVRVVDAIQVENVRDELRERRYRISPEDFRKAEANAEERNLGVVGFYHSHPDHPARPSATDLAEATFPGYVYIIMSVNRGQPGSISAWTLDDSRTEFVQEDLTIINEALEVS